MLEIVSASGEHIDFSKEVVTDIHLSAHDLTIVRLCDVEHFSVKHTSDDNCTCTREVINHDGMAYHADVLHSIREFHFVAPR